MFESRSTAMVMRRPLPGRMAIVAFALASTIVPALAGDGCDAMRSALESLTDDQHARALLKQLSATEADMRSAECAGETVSFRPPPSPRCPALTYRATVLRRFLAAHDPTSLPSDDAEIASRRAILRAALSELGCNGFAGRRGAPDEGQWQGSYRTLCVRRCDGYFFPVSWATTAAHFNRDEAACRSRYPSGEAELYIQQNPAAESSHEIMSLAGEAYSSKPFAFSFRHSFDRSCAMLFRLGAALAGDPPPTPPPGPPGARLWSSELVLPTSSTQSQEAGRRVRIVGSSSYYAIPETEVSPLPEIGAKKSPE